jgi:hypothetical protein
MKIEIAMASKKIIVASAIAATSASTLSPVGLTWWAVGTALVGAASTLVWGEAQQGINVIKTVARVFAWAFIAALLAHAAPSLPKMDWSSNVLLEARAGLIAAGGPFLVWLGKLILGERVNDLRQSLSKWISPKKSGE